MISQQPADTPEVVIGSCQLYGVSAFDSLTLTGVALFLLAIAALACFPRTPRGES
ncbi:MAG TPA: hypothetical protein VFV58_31275 [Blastocatellia bacterium]|nr:hypothetical protein [Blastocatellia bacterium]